MLHITLICVGGLKEPFWKAACAEYEKRLSAWAKLSVIEIPEERLPEHPSPAQIAQALQAEATRIRQKMPTGAFITALCIEGTPTDSQAFARTLERGMQSSGKLAFLIGGSYGLSEELKGEARYRLSFSPMTFPHMLARVMLFEQLYRAMNILSGGKYHK